MKKVILQGFLIVGLFFSVYFLFNQFDWMNIFNVNKMSQTANEKLGKLYWEFFKESEKEINNTIIKSGLDSILTVICNSNNIDKEKIKLHILEKEEVNAFALPDGHLVIYSELILESEDVAEFSGVLCHELAHIELNHVMRKLIKEVGLSTMLSMASGGEGVAIFNETAKLLSSSAYDRKLEKEADLEAVEFLKRSNINPEFFATFLYRLSQNKGDNAYVLTWINSHPELEQRVEYIIENSEGDSESYKPVLSNTTWIRIQEILKGENSNYSSD